MVNQKNVVSPFQIIANKKRICYSSSMDEGRKRVLLIAASILAARKLPVEWNGKPTPASEPAMANAIAAAERILSKIDDRWPTSGKEIPRR
jgi:hypothetical protein